MDMRGMLVAVLLVGGCAYISPIARPCTLILKPQIDHGRLSQAVVAPYDKAAIHHLTLKLYVGAQDTGITKTLINAQLDNPVVFSNLRNNTTYRVKAYAYASPDDSELISYDDANSWTDIAVTTEDRPTLGTLKVKLIDRSFNGQASASLAIYSGGYSAIASISMAIPRAVVATVAGNGTNTPPINGPALSGTLSGPHQIAFDSSGNLYIADYHNNTVRRLANGTLSTLAGNGGGSWIGTPASFNCPHGVAVDASGTIYVTDSYNHRICKVTPAGVVSTWVGSGTAGFANGQGTLASFNKPIGLVFDSLGNLYTADANHAIRKITPAGLVSTLAGDGSIGTADGSGAAARFNLPRYLACDSQDNLYVSDTYNFRIRKITPQGVVTTVAGNGSAGFADGQGSAAAFTTPECLAVGRDGLIYLSDRGNHRIRTITPDGLVTTLTGNGTAAFADGNFSEARFNTPIGLAFDAMGELYVGDYGNNRIRKIH